MKEENRDLPLESGRPLPALAEASTVEAALAGGHRSDIRAKGFVPYQGLFRAGRRSLPWIGLAWIGGAAPAFATEAPPNVPRPNPPQVVVQTRTPVDPYAMLDQMGQGLEVIERQYVAVPDRGQLLLGALRGMVAELDPHSVYFPKEALEIFEGDTRGEFGGIGVEVDFENGEVVIIAPVEGSPADRAGLIPGDVIVSLNGVPLVDQKADAIIQNMRGPLGSKVRLTIRSPNGETRDVTLVREAIRVTSVRSVALVSGVHYLRIKSFQEGTASELQTALADYRREHGQENAILLDLRNNPGGLVREASAVADDFLEKGVIFETRHRGVVQRRQTATRGGAATHRPLIVLINEYSASAAELLAGALKDHGRAELFGARTFGKGSVQTLVYLSHGGALKLTTALYYTPNGRSLQARGVEPDVAVDPGYVNEVHVLTERDLPGHLIEGEPPENPRFDDASGAPPTTKELHHGVLRIVPADPRGSPDRALSLAFARALELAQPTVSP